MHRPWLLFLFVTAAFLSHLSGQDKVITRWLVHDPLPADTGFSGLVIDHFGGERFLLLKVRNRTGGFDLMGRVASADEASVSDLTLQTDRPATLTEHNYPRPTVAMGPLHLADPATWLNGSLQVRGSAPIAAWGADTLRRG